MKLCTVCKEKPRLGQFRALYCVECSKEVKKARIRAVHKRIKDENAKYRAMEKKPIDPKWLVRGNPSNYSRSDAISNGG